MHTELLFDFAFVTLVILRTRFFPTRFMLIVIFDGKPDSDVRDKLKSRGFRWAPSVGAWQRQRTVNAMWAAKSIVEVAK